MKRFLFVAFPVLVAQSIFAQRNPCDSFKIFSRPAMPLMYSPDSTKYFVNRQDAKGIFQVYIGTAKDSALTCISLDGPPSAKRAWKKRNKLQVQWHKSGKFLICAVEWEDYPELHYVPYRSRLGLLQCGVWMDIYAVTPDGKNWYPLVKTEHGFTGPAFTPAGNKCVWAEALNNSDLTKDKFGRWTLKIADFVIGANGVPSLANIKDINPVGSHWIEPGNFSPDGVSLLVTSDIGLADARGQDQFILNINTGEIKNLTNSPNVWDEHGVFSADGSKILFMSSYPYRSDPTSDHIIGIKTEFMIMNADGTGLQQLTHFCTKGFPESGSGIAATGFWSNDGSAIYCQTLNFPDYKCWMIKFEGNCGSKK